MPTQKIADLPEHEACLDRDHNPPGTQVFEPGVYEHTCPSCGHVQRFTVRRPRWGVRWGSRDAPWWSAERANINVYDDGHEVT